MDVTFFLASPNLLTGEDALNSKAACQKGAVLGGSNFTAFRPALGPYYIYIYVYVYMYMYICIDVYMYICIYVYMYMYMYIHV